VQTRPLGKTGYSVGVVGFGGWGLGGDLWRDVDVRDAQRVLYQAVEHGVDFIDTASVYGNSESERLIGEVVRDLRARDRVVVATKVAPADGRWTFGPEAADYDQLTDLRPLHTVFPITHMMQSIDRSLRNLRSEGLPLVQLHVWHDAWLEASAWPELRGMMERCVHAGKVLHWGVSIDAHQPGTATKVLADPLIETVQLVYNVWNRTAEAELLPAAAAAGTGVIVRCPFDEGALTGAITYDTVFPTGDWRGRYFRDDRLAELRPHVERLRALVQESHGEVESLPELALRLAIDQPQTSVVIPGMRRAAHLHANLATAERPPLSASLRARLGEERWDRNWYL
jgi:aryl-alcohol dehydrogenase-like predicted oxidoreductase